MKVLIFTKEDAPEMRDAIDLGKKLEEEDYIVEYYDAEDVGTEVLQELYDIYDFPSFVAVQDDGSENQRWLGRVPLASDLKMFLNN